MNRQLLSEQAARVQAEAAEKRFRCLAEAIPQIVWEFSPEGVFEYTSPRWFEYTGQSPAEARTTNPSDWVHPDHVEDWKRGWSAFLAQARWRVACHSTSTSRIVPLQRFRISCWASSSPSTIPDTAHSRARSLKRFR